MKKVMAIALAAIILILSLCVSVSAATKPVPGYYVVGTMNNWSLDKNCLMQEHSDCSLTLYPVSLTTEDEFKIVYSSDGIQKSIWYPSGVENNITVDEDSDLYELSMAPAGLGVPEEWGGFYFTAEITDAPSVGPEPTVPRDAFKELWESGAKLSAKDIEEAVNDKRQSTKWIFADAITVYNSYRFNCTPAFLVDYELAGGGCYACVILEQITGDYLFTSPSSYEPCIFADNKLYSFTKAYEAGVLTDEMLDELINANYNSGTEYNNWSLLRNVKGDADGDGEISIIDATVVQRYDVGIMSGVGLYKALADADGDSEVTVTDATVIQRYEAGMSVPRKSEEGRRGA